MKDEQTNTPRLILHIPHAATHIPPAAREAMLPDDKELCAELLKSTDWFTDELFRHPLAVPVVFPVSRLVVDPERFIDDSLEPMAAIGRGVIYQSTADQTPLSRPLTDEERETRLAAYYKPHHAAFERIVDQELARCGKAVIVDCHSFPTRSIGCDLDPAAPRPAFCLGTDSYHTPASLTEAVVSRLRARGHDVSVNRPYAGSIVPLKHYRNDPRVQSIMIEVRRDLYMIEDTGTKRPTAFEHCRELITELLDALLKA